jgi:hypothetical protein
MRIPPARTSSKLGLSLMSFNTWDLAMSVGPTDSVKHRLGPKKSLKSGKLFPIPLTCRFDRSHRVLDRPGGHARRCVLGLPRLGATARPTLAAKLTLSPTWPGPGGFHPLWRSSDQSPKRVGDAAWHVFGRPSSGRPILNDIPGWHFWDPCPLLPPEG